VDCPQLLGNISLKQEAATAVKVKVARVQRAMPHWADEEKVLGVVVFHGPLLALAVASTAVVNHRPEEVAWLVTQNELTVLAVGMQNWMYRTQ